MVRRLETLTYKEELKNFWVIKELLCEKKIRFILRGSPELSFRRTHFSSESGRSHENIKYCLKK